jgi:predicted dehydrogenase
MREKREPEGRAAGEAAKRPLRAGPLRTAVTGCGIFGQYHVRAYAECPRSELALICDLDGKRARGLARTHGCEYTTKTADVARRADVQAVSICTPDFAHAAVALEMIRAGKHLLIEKPLATTVREAARILEAARKAGVRVMVDFHNRFSAPFVAAKAEIDAGNLGRVVTGFARLSNKAEVPLKWLSWAGKSGPQWFLLPHVVDLVRWLTGDEAKEVFAVGTKGVLKAKGVDAYDTVQALVRFQHGSVQFDTSWILPEGWPSNIDFRVELIGTKGTLAVDATHQLLQVAGPAFRYPFTTGSLDVHGETSGFFHLPIRHFVDCLLDDRPFACTGEDGLAATRIVEAMERSMKTGKPVRLSG